MEKFFVGWNDRGEMVMSSEPTRDPMPRAVKAAILGIDAKRDSAAVAPLHLVSDTPVFAIGAPVISTGTS